MLDTIFRLNFFFELPFDPGVPNQSTVSFHTSEPIPGTESLVCEPIPGVLPRNGISELVSVWFRRQIVECGLSDKTLEFWKEELAPSTDNKSIHVQNSATAIQLTRVWKSANRSIVETAASEDTISKEFNRSLDVLNKLLVACGIGSNNSRCGPIVRQQLPPFVPFILSRLVDGQDPTNCHRGLLMVHGNVPVVSDEMTELQLNSAIEMVAEEISGRHVFFTSGEFFLNALRLHSEMRYGHAVIEAQTGFEVLCDSLIRTVGRLRGLDENRIKQLQELPFRNKVEHHLGKLVNVQIDLSDLNTSFGNWWACGYNLRNRVAHDGYRPSGDESGKALDSIFKIVEEIGLELKKQPETRKLSRYILRDS